MQRSYVKPIISTHSDLYFSAVTQNYLTDLPGCNSDLICNNGVASGGIEACASGITDPSQLNGCSFANQLDCSGTIVVQDTAVLTGCVDESLGCPGGSIGVNCEFTGDCAPLIDCIFLASGISCDGEFIACPD
jgi:hypothetical protein